jgi:prepilin-type N-terminal cleavage/methylation domain-containing protein
MRNQTRPAFTLVELMVAMSIVAVLIGMSVFGISTAQRNLRDNQRRDIVKSIAGGLANYYTNNSSYPSVSTFAALNTAIGGVPVQGVTLAATSTTANGTRYCYSVTADGYVLGALLEGGTVNWFNLGTGSQKCQDSAAYVIAP